MNFDPKDLIHIHNYLSNQAKGSEVLNEAKELCEKKILNYLKGIKTFEQKEI